MTDDPTDDTIDTAADASGAVELALRLIPPTAWEGMFLLGKIATDPKAVRRHLRQLHDALASVTAGQDKLAADRAEHDAQLAKDRAELAAERAKLREKEIELANAKEAKEDREAERARYIRELIQTYEFVGEEDDVRRGFRQSEFSTLMKMRAAHGYASDATAGLDEIAAHMREKLPVSRTVRTDPQGVDFPAHVSLSRSEPQPVRVRVGRRTAGQAGAA